MYMFFTLGLFWTLIYIIFRFKNIILNVSVQFIIKSERTLSVNCVNTYEKYVFDLKTSYNLIFMFDIIDSIFDEKPNLNIEYLDSKDFFANFYLKIFYSFGF
jgi:hypothetical protein